MDESTEKGKKSLEVRLSEIEDKLNELLGVGKRETKASEEDIQTYKKVLRALLMIRPRVELMNAPSVLLHIVIDASMSVLFARFATDV